MRKTPRITNTCAPRRSDSASGSPNPVTGYHTRRTCSVSGSGQDDGGVGFTHTGRRFAGHAGDRCRWAGGGVGDVWETAAHSHAAGVGTFGFSLSRHPTRTSAGTARGEAGQSGPAHLNE